MERQTADPANLAPRSFRRPVVAGAVRVEHVRRRAIDREVNLVADHQPAIGAVLRGDGLPVRQPRIDQSPLAEALDQLDLGLGGRGTIGDAYRFRPQPKPKLTS